MNEQDIRDNIKFGIKSPSYDFTEKVMDKISIVEKEKPWIILRNTRLLAFASCLILVASIFVKLPEIQFFDKTIRFSPAIMPIISLFIIFIVFSQLYDLRKSIFNTQPNNVVQQAVKM